MADVEAEQAPTGLSARGRALWEGMSTGRVLDPGQSVLLAEACRCADRLERLNGILRGRDREWLTLTESESGDLTVVVDGVLSEARQQQLALRQMLHALGVGKLSEVKGEGGSFLDDLAKRRRDRQSAAQTS